ncbi:MAG: hypothetical protein QOE40_2034 [Actinomycetota bacterium]|nr:hypothetical protein [Actinomycetota bacterium]
MNRRFALVALWAVFAAASVGVGFGAAGLVGTPFTDVGSASRGNQAGAANAASIPSDSSSSVATSPAEDSSAPSKSAKTAKSATSAKANKSASARRSAAVRAATAAGTKRAASKSASPRSRATRSSGGGGGGATKAAASATVTHGSVSTRGGYVSGTCRSGLIALSASPAVGWRLDGVSGGYSVAGEAEFEQSADSESKVKVDAWCAAGKPAFSVENRDGGGGGGGGGGGDGSGSGGGGGSDD